MKWNKYIIFSLIISVIVLAVIIALFPDKNDNNLTVVFADTGNSDSIFIKMPDGKMALIDGGKESSLRSIHDVLYKYEVSRIDYMINTHQHDDHLGSFPDLLRIYDVGNFYMPESDIENEDYEKLMEILKDQNIPVNIIKRGDIICDGEVRIEVLSPYFDFEIPNENNYSAVLLLTYNNRTFLFTGDAEGAVMNSLVSKYGLSHCDVLKAGHHGSDDATSYYALEIISPKYAVVTSEAVKDNSKEYIRNIFDELNTEYYFTGESGNITMTCDGDNIEIKTERKHDK